MFSTLILKIDSTEETLSCATALAKQDWSITRQTLNRRLHGNDLQAPDATHFKNNKVASLTPKLSDLFSIKKKNIKHIVCLGHSHKSAYGDFKNAQAFVDKLCEKYGLNELKNINEMSLIGCEVGAITSDNESLAQTIANLLFDKGLNIKIHAVSTKLNNDNDELFVMVIDRPSIMATFQMGYIYGYINNENNEKLFPAQHPAVILAAEKNIFIPYESTAQRNKRIALDETKRAHDDTLDKIIGHIQYILLGKKEKKREKDIALLETLISDLCNATPDKWKGLLKTAYEKKSKFWGNGETAYRLEECIKQCKDIPEPAVEVKKVRIPSRTITKSVSSSCIIDEYFASGNESPVEEKQLTAGHRNNNLQFTKFQTHLNKAQEALNLHNSIQEKESLISNASLLFKFKNGLSAANNKLSKEIATIENSSFLLFFRKSALTVKKNKQAAIEDMLASKDFSELIEKSETYKKIPSVMSGMFSRTAKQIKQILKAKLTFALSRE